MTTDRTAKGGSSLTITLDKLFETRVLTEGMETRQQLWLFVGLQANGALQFRVYLLDGFLSNTLSHGLGK